ncbi:TasA family protein [Rossellomorea aquimaris]|uniref:Uncharacterized protein n=1 Tax=Rossellomorea aquimaris TaxID=189382 RepID=A0A1J6WPF4_9BACI|nr:TasA family protein [Rossellomorea aquimaris]OIU67713.1 hypothetical protein BHE18_12865 [Rossellomorea aquimaris]
MKIIYKIVTIIIISSYLINTDIFAEENTKEHRSADISVSPSPILFNLTNMKPGDKITRNITISNRGKQDFSYLFKNTFLSGSEKFYNELILDISDGNKTLAEGKVKDFKNLDLRNLERSDSKTYEISIEIPYGLGNEYQGLMTEFQFDFLAEGPDGAVTSVAEGSLLPDTGTDYFNYLMWGSSLFLAGICLYILTRRKLRLSDFSLKERKNV